MTDTLRHEKNQDVLHTIAGIAAKGDVNLENGYSETKDDYGLKYKEHGLLSHKTTTIKSHNESKTATGSLLSGVTVQMEAGTNITIKGSSILGIHDVTMTSGKDTTIEKQKRKKNTPTTSK